MLLKLLHFRLLPCPDSLDLTLGVLQQHTLQDSVAFSGVGLHSGNKVQMSFLPAAANTGIRFRRTDLEGKPEIEANVEHVGETNRSTTLARGNVKIHTVEHVLSAFSGLGIDNAIVELDANEPPIGDGSSRLYAEAIARAGITVQAEKREPLVIQAPIELQSGESIMSVFPCDRFRISCTSSDKAGRFTQFFTLEVNPETWRSELAIARTFCFFEEIEYLIKNGLIKGGSLENAIVIRDDAVLTTEPLRFPDEFVRHKILDIVGDLALIGRPIHGHVMAMRPGHRANCELARLILNQDRKPKVTAQAFAPPERPATPASKETAPPVHPPSGCVMDIDAIMKVLPHRYPFLMVDRIVEIQGNRIQALKNVSVNEPFFQGHFPGHPIMPGVMQLEAIAQVAGILMLRQAENIGRIAYFMSAESVKWRKPVRPGDHLVIDVELTKTRGKIGRAKGVCSVAGETVSEAEVTFMLVES